MKVFFLLSTMLLLLCCNEPKEEKVKNKPAAKPESTTVSSLPQLDLKKNSSVILSDWINYYKTIDPGFSLDSFRYVKTDSMFLMQGSVPGAFDQNYDKIYDKFMVYSPDETRYIDFDSYKWSLDKKGYPMFGPDQEINLADIKQKTVTRIAFRGPSYWVEDVFWKNDSVVVLLENSTDKYPMINVYRLNSKLIESYIYAHSLSAESRYSELRLKQKGLNY